MSGFISRPMESRIGDILCPLFLSMVRPIYNKQPRYGASYQKKKLIELNKYRGILQSELVV